MVSVLLPASFHVGIWAALATYPLVLHQEEGEREMNQNDDVVHQSAHFI